jgi:hypothetical protein
MPTLIIKTNASQATDVLVKDLGVLIPSSGGSDEHTDYSFIEEARLSSNLRTYCTDDAFGAGSSTLILNDGTDDIPQNEIDSFLSNVSGLRGTTGVQGNTGIQGLTGISGVTGLRGLTGSQGETGVLGLTGIPGATGAQGHTGSQGLTGVAGVTGLTGLTGAQGHTGSQGSTGVAGVTGLTGLTGAQGHTGSQGITGLIGVTGLIGLTGSQGHTGVHGLTGLIGLTGAQGHTGIVGVTGTTGPTGMIGITGAQGYTGPVGPTGIVGATGSQGLTGIQGIQGDTGSVGLTGAQGTTGVSGETGLTGLTGAQGYTGTMGVTGLIGLTGAQGHTGAMGVPGLIGLTGSQGETGSQGYTGPIGPTGLIGETGAQGYTGSQGLTGVAGVTGLTGETGVQGIQGHTGVQGLTGIAGVTGLIGVTGAQGETGAQGFTGLQGVTGLVGETGAQGHTGSQGFTGIIGSTGFIGETGSQGYTGVQGITGTRGITGLVGVTGLQNATGIQGETGPQGLTGYVGITGLQGETGYQGYTGAIGPDFKVDQVRYVALNGSDSTGDGSYVMPYATVKKACDSITDSAANKTYAVYVHSGVYTEDPFTIPTYTFIFPLDESTVIQASNNAVDLITVGDRAGIGSMEIRGPTSAYAVNITDAIGIIDGVSVSSGLGAFFISGSLASDTELVNCYVDLDLTYGIVVQDNAIHVTIRDLFSYADTRAIKVSGGSQVDLTGATIYTSLLAFEVDESGTKVRLANVKIASCTSGIETDGASTTTINGASFFDCVTEITQKNNSAISIASGFMDILRFVVDDWAYISGQFVDQQVGAEGPRVLGPLNVGVPEKISPTSLGQGGALQRGALVYTYNVTGGVYTDVTSTSPFTYPSNLTNSAIYMTSTVKDYTGGAFRITGMLLSVSTAAVPGTGSIVAEYWDGGSWTSFNTMSVSTTTYYTYGGKLFERVTTYPPFELVNFEIQIDNPALWVVNDPMTLGTNYYWVRFRLAGPLTTVPIINYIRTSTNFSYFSYDGFQIYSGKARPLRVLYIDNNTFMGTNNVPGNVDLYLGSVGAGKNQNGLMAKSYNSFGFNTVLPYDIDTSCRMPLTIFYAVSDDTTGTVELKIKWDISTDDAPIDITGGTPTATMQTTTLSVSIAASSSKKQKYVTTYFSIPAATTFSGTTPYLMWVEISRDARFSNANDTYAGDFRVLQVHPAYYAWNNGRHF